MAARKHSPGKKTLQPRRALVKRELRQLREKLGTKEAARQLGIPAASLRRLLGKGKSAGLPKRASALAEYETALEVVNVKRGVQELAHESWLEGRLDLDYQDLAERYGLDPREVYSLGISPKL